MRLRVRPPADMTNTELDDLGKLDFPKHWWILWPLEDRDEKLGVPAFIKEKAKRCKHGGVGYASHYCFEKSVWTTTVLDSILFDCIRPSIAVHFSSKLHPDEYIVLDFPPKYLAQFRDLLRAYFESSGPELKMLLRSLRSLAIDIYALHIVQCLKVSGVMSAAYFSCVAEGQRRAAMDEALKAAQEMAETITLAAEGHLDMELDDWVERMVSDNHDDLLEELLSQESGVEALPSSSASLDLSSTPRAGASSDTEEYSSPIQSPTRKTKKPRIAESTLALLRKSFDLDKRQLCDIDSRACILLPPPLQRRGLQLDFETQEAVETVESFIIDAINSIRRLEQKIEDETTIEYGRMAALLPEPLLYTPAAFGSGSARYYWTRIVNKLSVQDASAAKALSNSHEKGVEGTGGPNSRLRNEYDLSNFKLICYAPANAKELVLDMTVPCTCRNCLPEAQLEGKSAVQMVLEVAGTSAPGDFHKQKVVVGQTRADKPKQKSTSSRTRTQSKGTNSSGRPAESKSKTLSPVEAGVLGSRRPSSSSGNNNSASQASRTSSPSRRQFSTFPSSNGRSRTASSSSETGEADDAEDNDLDWEIGTRGRDPLSNNMRFPQGSRADIRYQTGSQRPLDRYSSSVDLQTDSTDSGRGSLFEDEEKEGDEETESDSEEEEKETGYNRFPEEDDDNDSVMPPSSPYHRSNWEQSDSDSSDDEMEDAEVAESLIPVPKSYLQFRGNYRGKGIGDGEEEKEEEEEDERGDKEDDEYITGLMSSILDSGPSQEAEHPVSTSSIQRLPAREAIAQRPRWTTSNDRDAESSDASGESNTDGEVHRETDINVMSELSAKDGKADDSGSFEAESISHVSMPFPCVKITYASKRNNANHVSSGKDQPLVANRKRKSEDECEDTKCNINEREDAILGVHGFLSNICEAPSPRMTRSRSPSVSPPKMPRSPPHKKNKRE